ncbi:MAG: bifunctional phosphoribosyl-AMP cyclohydrolase/phosphoribosyl-ATP pyrophosphatase, partial [Lachnospiraceae bacterium]|nr:bifunctional phosphoribosyl-AMP cyclohydrolase/phosphoribosyl-ATP pyrophosphatase [Lachnospiraceae bacterium]
MNTYKKFIPCIYLKDKKAVAGFQDETVVSEEPTELARLYGEYNADEIIIYDLSKEDIAHEEALDIIKAICERAQVPIIGAGNVKRMEDVKKLLYAGCTKAVLNYSKEENIEITKEVSQKFGKEKILACIAKASEIESNAELLTEFVSGVILLGEKTIKQAMQISQLPLIVTLPEVSLDKIIELLSYSIIHGVTGPAINANVKELTDIKDLCAGNGVTVRTFEPQIK